MSINRLIDEVLLTAFWGSPQIIRLLGRKWRIIQPSFTRSVRIKGHKGAAVVLPASHIAAVFISVTLLFGIWSITQDWCVSWFMTTAALIPLHTQTFINELLLEEREPLVSVKHTRVLLMSSLSAHTVVSLSAPGHAATLGFRPARAGQTWWRAAIVPLFCGENALTLTVPLSQPRWTLKAPAMTVRTLLLSTVGTERLPDSLIFDGWRCIQAGSVCRRRP